MTPRQLRDKVIQMGSSGSKREISGYISNLRHRSLDNLFYLYNSSDFEDFQKEMWAYEIGRRCKEDEMPPEFKLEAILIAGDYL